MQVSLKGRGDEESFDKLIDYPYCTFNLDFYIFNVQVSFFLNYTFLSAIICLHTVIYGFKYSYQLLIIKASIWFQVIISI